MRKRQQEIEEVSMAAWPSLITHVYDGWILRISQGYTKRANSINPLYSSRIDPDEKIAYCRDFYASLQLPTTYKLLSGHSSIDLDRKLDSLGYREIERTSVQVLDLKTYHPPKNRGITAESEGTDEWIHAYMNSSGVKEGDRPTCRQILKNIRKDTIWASKIVEGKRIGYAFGVLDREYIGIFGLYVEESFRKQGIGREIVETILDGAKERAASKAYLQVVCSNAPAQKLYGKIGFQESYQYWYRSLP